MYHVDLDLTPARVKRLQELALADGLKVRRWVTAVVEAAIDDRSRKGSRAMPGSKPRSPVATK